MVLGDILTQREFHFLCPVVCLEGGDPVWDLLKETPIRLRRGSSRRKAITKAVRRGTALYAQMFWA